MDDRRTEERTEPDEFKILDFGRILRVMAIALGAMLALLIALILLGKALGRF